MFHGHPLGDVIAQVVAFIEQGLMFPLDPRLVGDVLGHSGREGLVDGNGLVAGEPPRPSVVAFGPL